MAHHAIFVVQAVTSLRLARCKAAVRTWSPFHLFSARFGSLSAVTSLNVSNKHQVCNHFRRLSTSPQKSEPLVSRSDVIDDHAAEDPFGHRIFALYKSGHPVDLQEAHMLFTKAKSSAVKLTRFTFNNMISVYNQMKDPEAVVLTFEAMRARRIRANPFTFTLLMDALIKNHRIDLAFAYWEEFSRDGRPPPSDVVLFARMIEEYGKAKRVVAARQYFHLAVSMFPSNHLERIFVVYMKAMKINQEYLEGIRAGELMRSKSIPWSVRVYTLQIELLGNVHMVMTASLLFEEMCSLFSQKKLSGSPDMGVYLSMIRVAEQNRKTDLATKYLIEAVQQKLNPPVSILCAVLGTCLRLERLEDAAKVAKLYQENRTAFSEKEIYHFGYKQSTVAELEASKLLIEDHLARLRKEQTAMAISTSSSARNALPRPAPGVAASRVLNVRAQLLMTKSSALKSSAASSHTMVLKSEIRKDQETEPMPKHKTYF